MPSLDAGRAGLFEQSVNGPSVALVLCQIKLLEFSQFQRQFVQHSVHFVERA